MDDKYTAKQRIKLNKIVAAVDLLSKNEHVELSLSYFEDQPLYSRAAARLMSRPDVTAGKSCVTAGCIKI